MQRLLWRKGDGMKQEIELSPFLLDALEHLFGLTLDTDIERHEDRRLEILRQRLDIFPGAVVQIGDRQLGSERAKRLGAAPGDRLIVGDADNQPLAPLERNLGLGKYRDVHDTFSLVWADGERFHSSANVCSAIISSSSVGTTRTGVVLGCEITSAWRLFSSGSSATPSQASRSAMRARMLTEFSPMPAVKTNASMPCRAAASIPAFNAAR